MIIDWRAHRYRGGSRWLSAGVLAVHVGVVSVASPPYLLPDNIIVATLTVEAPERTLTSAQPTRTLIVTEVTRTITFDG